MNILPTSSRISHVFLGLALVTASAGAQNPCQRQKLQAQGAINGDFLGKSVALEGSTAVVGMYALLNGANDGRAYVYEQQGSTWVETAQLVQSDASAGSDEFGNSVGVSDDVIVVGAEFNDNELGNNAGAAYVFEKIGGVWTEVAKLTASDGAGERHYGENVAVSNGTIVVGQRENGTLGNNAGAAYVYEKVGGVWTETAKLLASDGDKNALFGDTVEIEDDTIVVGSYKADAGGANGPGAVYVFQDLGGTWTEVQKLSAGDLAGGGFGRSVDVAGDTIVVGAWKDSTQVNEGGSAYVFEDQDGVWVEVAKLLPSLWGDGDWFGHSVGVSGDSIVVSAHKNDLAGFESGGAFLFQDAGAGWNEVAFLQSNDIASLDQFGQWLAIDGANLVLGAPFESNNRGAGYVFEVDCTSVDGSFTRYGDGVGGANIGDLDSDDVPNPGTLVNFDVTGIPNGTNGFLWYSLSQTSVPFKGGTILSDFSTALRITPITLSGGATQVPLNIPVTTAGLVVHIQAGVFDATQTQGIALTNGLTMTVGS